MPSLPFLAYFGTGNTICGEPALAYGRLYVASRDGCVYCFLPAKEGEPTTPEQIRNHRTVRQVVPDLLPMQDPPSSDLRELADRVGA